MRNMEFSKKNLLSLIKQTLNEAPPMQFDTPDRPARDIQTKLAQGETPLKKIPFPKTGQEPNMNFQELLASERYKQIVEKFRQYTGIQTPLNSENGLGPLAMMMMNAHNTITEIEEAHREELEQLAIRLVMKEMAIPEGSLQFDAKIVVQNQITTDEFNREMEQEMPEIEPVDIEKDLMDELEELSLEKAKRRLINNMIQGAAKRGHYMYHYAEDEVRQITGSDELINLYGILMSINDTLYWQLSDSTMQQMMGGGGGQESMAGREDVDRNTTPPTIVARAVNFPVLIHELIKGIMELFAIQGRPEGEEGGDAESWEDVESSEDTFEKEVWDLRLGPAIWDRIRKQFPEDILTDENKKELQNYLIVSIFKLPAKQFLVLMREVISGTDTGARLLNELSIGINQMFKDRDYKQALDNFRADLEDTTRNTSDDDLDDLLGSLGISRPKE